MLRTATFGSTSDATRRLGRFTGAAVMAIGAAGFGFAGPAAGAGAAPALDVDGPSCSGELDVSADGRVLVFDTTVAYVATDTESGCDVYLRDTTTGRYELVSSARGGGAGDRPSVKPSISSNGRYVAFESAATNLVPGDGNGLRDVFVRDRTTGSTTLVSRTAKAQGNDGSYNPDISGNGATVAFESDATNLAGATGGSRQILQWRRASGVLARVSSAGGSPIAGGNVEPSSDDDGSVVAFRTGSATYAAAPGLHAGMVRNLAASTTKAVPPTCHAPAPPCVPDVVSGPELDGAGARVVMGVSEAPYDGYSDTAEMIRLGNGQELFHVANDWRVPEVAISRDGRVLATSNQQGDFIPIGGARGSECLDDPDDTGDIALTGNGGAIAFLEYGENALLQRLNYADGHCVLL
jgi:hypothetical protein